MFSGFECEYTPSQYLMFFGFECEYTPSQYLVFSGFECKYTPSQYLSESFYMLVCPFTRAHYPNVIRSRHLVVRLHCY
ncbi:hypothetical protein Hanom_Chr17g01552271 [Helianthus anomalus]